MKFIHNDKAALGWAIFVEFGVHLLFAFQAFLLGGFIGEIALKSVFGDAGANIGSWALAVFIFGAAFQAFVLGEYMREHVESFESTAKGDGSYIRNWKLIRWIVGGLEISSLLFRCIVVATQGDLLQAGILALFSLLGLWYAFAQAKVIHASVNRPVEYEVMRARDMAGRSVVSDAMRYVPRMTAGDKQRFLTGDLSVIEQYQQDQAEKLQPKAEKRNKARQRQEHSEQEQRIARGYTGKLLGGGDDPLADYPFMNAQAGDLKQARSNGLGVKNNQN